MAEKKLKCFSFSIILFLARPAFGQMGFSDGAGSENSSAGAGSAPVLSDSQKEKISLATSDEITEKNFPEIIESFDFNNAEITDVIKAISELTGKNFILDTNVRGKITILAPSKISVAEAYRAFLSALAVNNLTIVPYGKFLKIKQVSNAMNDNIETYAGDYFPNSDQLITRIVHLKHISAEQVSRDLRSLIGRGAQMYVYAPTNSLIISDFGSNVERVMKILNQLDMPGFEEKLVVIPIKHAKAKDIADLVNRIVNKDSSTSRNGSSFSAGVPRFTTTGSQGAGGRGGTAYFMVIPDDRTNSLIVTGNNSGIARVRKLISQLDFRIKPEESGGVYVYYVKHGDAKKIATTLSGIAKDSSASANAATQAAQRPGLPSTPQAKEVFGGDVKIAADEDTNSLIITASKQDYEAVLNLLSKIDIQRDQVFVEAIIMEMALEESGKYGVGYFNFDKESDGAGRVGFNGLGSDLQNILNPIGGEGAILGFGSGSKVEVDIGGTTREIPSLVGFINFLKGVGRTNILSTPQIMALDNEDAEIEVGEEVATSTKSTTTNGVTEQSAVFKDATLKLKIKPFVSPSSDSIRMKIEQKIDQPKAKGEIPNTLTIAKRSINTNIVVPDGDTAVLGGLMKDEETEVVTKVPLLGDIPIIGWLFKSRSKKKNKVNLLVFLTPKIVRSSVDSGKVLSKKLEQRLDMIKQTGGRDPFGRYLDEMPKRASLSKSGSNSSRNKGASALEKRLMQEGASDTESFRGKQEFEYNPEEALKQEEALNQEEASAEKNFMEEELGEPAQDEATSELERTTDELDQEFSEGESTVE